MTLEVIEEGIPEMGPSDVLEKYVMVTVLASHPQLYARPLMDNIVKIWESESTVATIPDRPIPLSSNLDDIETSISSSERGLQSSSFSGNQVFLTAKEE